MVNQYSKRNEACHGPKSIIEKWLPELLKVWHSSFKSTTVCSLCIGYFLRTYIRIWCVPIILFSFCNNTGCRVSYDLHWEHPWVSSWISLLYQCWKAFQIISQTSLVPFFPRLGWWTFFGFQKAPKSFYQVLLCTISFWLRLAPLRLIGAILMKENKENIPQLYEEVKI